MTYCFIQEWLNQSQNSQTGFNTYVSSRMVFWYAYFEIVFSLVDSCNKLNMVNLIYYISGTLPLKCTGV